MDAFRQGRFLKRPLLIMGRAPHHKQLGYLLLKACLASHRGYAVGLDELVTMFLTADKKEFTHIRDSRILLVFLGDEYTQTIHRWMVEHLLQIRSEDRFSTIWAAPCFSNALVSRYGQFPVFDGSGSSQVIIPDDFKLE